MLIGKHGEDLDRGLWRTVDWRLILCFLLLVLFGWLNIYSSVRSAQPDGILDFRYNCGKQFIWMMVSFAFAILVLFILNPGIWEVAAVPSYLVVLSLLVLVIFVGSSTKGSHSWFEFGPVKFQPAELSKITTSLMLSLLMSRQNFKMSSKRDFFLVALTVLVPMAVIVAEQETGSALVYVGFLFMFYREGLSGWFIALMFASIAVFVITLKFGAWWAVLFVAVLSLAYYIYVHMNTYRGDRERKTVIAVCLLCIFGGVLLTFASEYFFDNILKDYQRGRIEVLLGIREDLKGVGYNVHQSLIAIGSGGVFGKGFLGGTQTAFGFVPEQSTDFIFCTVGEEYGFVGCVSVIIVYVLMMYFIISDAEEARSRFTRVYGYCLVSCFFMHLVINIGMTLGLVPVIGIPLPLLSYGGSSLLTFTTMLFIFIALDRQEKKYF